MPSYPLKRFFDIVLSLGLLVATSPFFLLATLLAMLDGRQPLFFQRRLGLNCEEFTIYKFTTMQTPAADSPPVDVKRDSAELTKIGRFLRNSCMDELPQLFNVLKGDMSLIGPRPHPPKHAQRYAGFDPRYYTRYCVRPGLVCIVQVTSLRYLTETAEHLKARTTSDLYYIQHMSLKQDLKIFYKAVCYILTLGAYKAGVSAYPVQPDELDPTIV